MKQHDKRQPGFGYVVTKLAKTTPRVKHALVQLIVIKGEQCTNGYNVGLGQSFIEIEIDLRNGGWAMSVSWSKTGGP